MRKTRTHFLLIGEDRKKSEKNQWSKVCYIRRRRRRKKQLKLCKIKNTRSKLLEKKGGKWKIWSYFRNFFFIASEPTYLVMNWLPNLIPFLSLFPSFLLAPFLLCIHLFRLCFFLCSLLFWTLLCPVYQIWLWMMEMPFHSVVFYCCQHFRLYFYFITIHLMIQMYILKK